jgi:DNA-binding response OmpR family regulator
VKDIVVVLLVDDEEDVISLFKMVLEMNRFEVDDDTDPAAALSNFKPNSYGLALLDIRMAPLNSFELYKKMKNIDDSLKHVSSQRLRIIVRSLKNHFQN